MPWDGGKKKYTDTQKTNEMSLQAVKWAHLEAQIYAYNLAQTPTHTPSWRSCVLTTIPYQCLKETCTNRLQSGYRLVNFPSFIIIIYTGINKANKNA